MWVRGLRGAEVEGAHDAADARPEHRLTDIRFRLAALAVVDASGAPVFRTRDDIVKLSEHIANIIASAAIDALAVISPTYQRSHFLAWRDALEQGAHDPTNRSDVALMMSAHDVVVLPSKLHFIERPDRYFGVPLNQITDGQLMAFRVARQELE